MDSPLVSVVIPTYNYSKYIGQAIESVLNQTYENIEIIVIDDGSTDDTSSVLAGYSDKMQYHFQTNSGLPAARNSGIALSTGEYIQFLDSDDRLGPQSIETKVLYLNHNPDKAFVCGPNRFFFEGKSYFYNLLQNLLYGWRLPNQRDIAATLCYGNIAPPHGFLTRREAITSKGLRFDEALEACEDYDFWLKLAIHCGAPGITEDGLVYYRKHASSMSSNQHNQLRYDSILIERAYSALENDQMPGSTPRLEYMTANLAAALKACYRLTCNGQVESASTMRDHIGQLLGQLESHSPDGPIRTTRYLSEMRIFAHKLARREITFVASADKIIGILTGGRLVTSWGYFHENLNGGSTMPELFNLITLDLQYIYLRLTQKRRSSNDS